MASDKTAVYRDSMSRGHELARVEKWAEATHAYRAAVSALSSDLMARTCLAQALYKSGNLGEAAREYEAVLKLSPKDVLVLTRAAEIRLALGQALTATELYLRAAETHLKDRRRDKALEAWGTITENCGSDLKSLDLLAKACANAREKQLEAEVHLGIARVHAEVADQKQAIKACRKAIDLDRSNSTALRMLTSLENGTNEWRSLIYLEPFKAHKQQNAAVSSKRPGDALEAKDSPASSVDTPVAVGGPRPIITADEGVDVVLAEAQRFAKAGDTIAAAAILCSAMASQSDGASAEVQQQLGSVLPGWQRLSCSELAALSFEDRRAVLQGMLEVEEFIRKKLNAAAVDACLTVIERAPGYLPAQMRLADIYLGDGDVEAAREKYSRIVQLYEMRDDTAHANEASARLVGLYAKDDSATEQLVENLVELGNTDLAVEEGLKAAERVVASGDARGGLDLLQKIQAIAPNRVDVNVRSAELALELGLVAEAKNAYRQAWAGDRSDNDLVLRLALCSARVDTWSAGEDYLDRFFQLLIDDQDFAFVAFKRILELGTDGGEKNEMKLCLAASLRGQGKVEHARRMLTDIVDGNGFVGVMARYLLALCLVDRGDFGGAIDELRSGLGELGDESMDVPGVTSGHFPDWLRSRYQRSMANVYGQLGDEANMLAVLEAIRSAAPDDLSLSQEIIGLYFSANKDDLALEEHDRLIGQQDAQAEREHMLSFYRALVKRFPNKAAVRKLYSDACVAMGLVADAAQQLEFAARLEMARGQKREAIDDMRRLVELYGRLSPERSLAAIEKLAEMAPEDVTLRLALIDRYLRMGLPSKSLQEAESLARKLLEQARHEGALGQSAKQAVDVLQKILSLEPRSIWALQALGSVLASMNRRDESITVFRRLLSLDAHNMIARRYLAELER